MPKNKHQTTILAIRPGRREMGIAVLSGKGLRYWGVTRFRQKKQEALLSALDQRLLRLISLYKPTVLAIEKPTPVRLQTSPWLKQITAHTRILARDAALRVYTYDPIQIRKCLCGSARATRSDLAQRIVETYPHLARYNNQVSRWQETYWMQMFAAVAVGMVCGER